MVVEQKSRKPLDKGFGEIALGIENENKTKVTQDIRKINL